MKIVDISITAVDHTDRLITLPVIKTRALKTLLEKLKSYSNLFALVTSMIFITRFFSTIFLLSLVIKCSNVDKLNNVVSATAYKPCNTMRPTCPSIPPITGCDCPVGYNLLVNFNTGSSTCVKTCFNVPTVQCASGQISQCLGTVLPLVNCQLSSVLNGYACSEGCGKLLVVPDGTLYCVDSRFAAVAGSTCPNGYAPFCATVSNTLNCQQALDLQALYSQLTC